MKNKAEYLLKIAGLAMFVGIVIAVIAVEIVVSTFMVYMCPAGIMCLLNS